MCKDKRNILVLSDRRDHLVRMSELLEERDYFNWGFYIGGMKELQLKLSENKQVILGTYQMCSEGYDNKNLDTLIMATSKSNIEQSVGRVLRKKVYDVEPLVVDIVDDFSALRTKQGNARSFTNEVVTRSSLFDNKTIYNLKNESKIINPINI